MGAKQKLIPNKTGAIFLLAIPIILASGPLDPWLTTAHVDSFGIWGLLTYPIMMLYGYLIFSNERISKAVQKHASISLLLGLATVIPTLQLYMDYLNGVFPYGSTNYIIFIILRAFNSWFWIVAFIGLARKYLNSKSRRVKYLNEGVLPFYMSHALIIAIINLYIY